MCLSEHKPFLYTLARNCAKAIKSRQMNEGHAKDTIYWSASQLSTIQEDIDEFNEYGLLCLDHWMNYRV